MAVPVLAVTISTDDASQQPYANGWQAGDNGGLGFGPWMFAFSGNDSGLFHDPQFIDRGPLAANSLSAPSFGLTTSDRANFSDTSEASRSFTLPLRTGESFSMDLDGSALDPSARPFTTGNTLQLFGSNGSERFGLFTNNGYHNNNWTATGEVNTGIPAANSFHFDFTLVTANTYNLAILPIGGTVPLFTQTGAALTGTAGFAITSLRVSAYGTGSSATGVKEFFFDNLKITGIASIDGDYNNNGIVDAADYVLWRKTRGQTGSGLAADGNKDNRIDAADYNVWKANFGLTLQFAANGPVVVVPEPATWLIVSIALGCILRRPNVWS